MSQPGPQTEPDASAQACTARIAQIAEAARSASSRGGLVTRILTEANVRRMAEIGVWRGKLSGRLLRDCPEIAYYAMIDPWRRLPDWNKPLAETLDFEKVYQEALSHTEFASDRREVLRGKTTEVIDRLEDASLDAIYVDGDHTLRGILVDMIAAYPKLRPGGLMLGDDFSTNPFQHGPGYEPTLVFPAAIHVAEAWGDPILILPYGQFAIVKSPQRAFSVLDTVGGHDDHSVAGAFGLRE